MGPLSLSTPIYVRRSRAAPWERLHEANVWLFSSSSMRRDTLMTIEAERVPQAARALAKGDTLHVLVGDRCFAAAVVKIVRETVPWTAHLADVVTTAPPPRRRR